MSLFNIGRAAWPAILLLSLNWASTLTASPVLTDEENIDVIQSIDNICGDTWCEGDSNWVFDELICDSETGCELKLVMKPYEYSETVKLSPRPFVCQLPEFKTKEAISEKTNRGLQYSQELYDAVSDCINDLNKNFGPIYVPVDSSCPSLFNASRSSTALPVAGPLGSHGTYGAINSVMNLIVEESAKDRSCTLEVKAYYRDKAACERSEATGEVCYLPTRKGSYTVTRDSNGSAVVVYIPKLAPNERPSLTFDASAALTASLPRIDLCQEPLALQPRYLAASRAAPVEDLRLRALSGIDELVKTQAADSASASCRYEPGTIDITTVNCRDLKTTRICSLPVSTGGSFHVIFDQKNGSQTIFSL